MRRPARKPNGDQNAPSLDSFLDVVTNLVGILIILIMVVGITARDALFDAATETLAEVAPPSLAIAAPTVPEPMPEVPVPEGPTLADLNSLADDIEAIQKEILQTQAQSKFAFEERNQLQLLLTAAETAVNEKQAQLESTKQQQVAEQRELLTATQQLESLQDQIEALRDYRPEVQELAHYPTPLAKTVFGNEEHFRLLGGRIVYVPMNRLVEQMKNDARNHLDRARRDGTATAQVGPVGGFRMEYTLISRAYDVETAMGTATRGGVELKNFVLVPEGSQLGEPVAQALQPGSRFREIVASFDPSQTTVTVWTYPDSYPDFRAIRDDLYEIGFTTAARPLPEDYPIGGSPQGERSSSQ